MRVLLALSISLLSLLLYGIYAQAIAQATPTGTCRPIFGGGETCKESGNLIVNKTIKTPTTNNFVDSLPQGVTFSPNQELTFQITVINNNNSTISNITITDSIPQYLSYLGGAGNFNKDKKELIISLDKLEGNKSKSYVIVTRVLAEGALPKDKNTTCHANMVQVKSGTRNSSDNVQFCIVKDAQAAQGTQGASTQGSFPTTTPTAKPQPQTVIPPTTTKGGQTIYPAPQTQKSPSTGPELLGLIGLLPAAGAGLYLRKKTFFK